MNLTIIKTWLSNESPIKQYIIEHSTFIGGIIVYVFMIGFGYFLWKERDKIQKYYIDFMIRWQMKINKMKINKKKFSK